MKSANSPLLPTEEFMKFHRELREASDRVISVTLDPQTALDVAALRAMENQEAGK
ncbi:hypothetical protein D3C76_1885760 [compost metagenome]